MKLLKNSLYAFLFVISVSLLIPAIANADYEWILDKSTVFADDAYEVFICFGDVNNDSSVDMVLGKHQDYQTGRTVAFQMTPSGWDSGTQIYAISNVNGNINPIITEIDGSNWLLINRHIQGNYGGDLRFLKYDNSLTLIKDYSVSLNHPYFSDQVVANQEIYFNTRGKLGKAEWNGAGFTATQVTDNGEVNRATTILADDLTGDGLDEIVYTTYDSGVRGLSILVDGVEFEIGSGFTSYIATGQFDSTTTARELLYFNSSSGDVVLVKYDDLLDTFVSQTVLTGQSWIRAIAAFDTNYDGVDEALMGLTNGDILKYDIAADKLSTVLTSGVFWNDAVVADWGEGQRAVFAGSESGDASVVSIGLDDPNAIIDDISGNSYLEGSTIDISWDFAGPSFTVHVQISEDHINWTTIATLNSQAEFCQLTNAVEGEYFLRIVSLLNTIVYGELEDPFYVYACDEVLSGDVDGNCYVNLDDTLLIAGDWLLCSNPSDASCSETSTQGDVNGDLYVDFADFSLLAFDWLECGNPYDESCSEI